VTAAALTRRRVPATEIQWVTWRQHRAAPFGLVILLGAVGLLLLGTGLALHRDWTRLGLDRCPDPTARACGASFAVFSSRWEAWAQFLPRFLMFLPAVVGVFLGAPLVARELESGTFRFAWTQGRSRLLWTAGKLLLLGSAVTLLALPISAAYSWWFGPWDPLMGRMTSGQTYEVAGIVFAARALFAFALGAFLGAVIRRTVATMAAGRPGDRTGRRRPRRLHRVAVRSRLHQLGRLPTGRPLLALPDHRGRRIRPARARAGSGHDALGPAARHLSPSRRR
jgi:hypothetical protein